MKMAKATEADIALALELMRIVSAIGDGVVPKGNVQEQDDDETEFFDSDSHEHLTTLLTGIQEIAERDRSCLNRVVWGMQVILDSDLLDKKLDHLAPNPQFELDATDADRYRYMRQHLCKLEGWTEPLTAADLDKQIDADLEGLTQATEDRNE